MKFLIILFLTCFLPQDTYRKEGTTFVQTVEYSKDILTKYTYKDTKGDVYPIYLHQYIKGEKEGQWIAYIIKVSKKSGKEYKQYIGQKIADDINKELNKQTTK